MRYLNIWLIALSSLSFPAYATEAEISSVAQLVTIAESEIHILEPMDDARLILNEPNILKYKIVFNGDDNHAYIFLDGEKIQLLRRSHGEYPLERMSLGNHDICIKLAYKDNLLTGLQRCIKVKVFPPKQWRAD